MPLDIWYREDIKNILVSLQLAHACRVVDTDDAAMHAFGDGFRAAILATAVSLGISTEDVALIDQEQVSSPRLALISRSQLPCRNRVR